MTQKIYLGVNVKTNTREIFKSDFTPTQETHAQYNYVIGAFRTMRGAKYMRDYGINNSACVTVYDAEKLAKESPNSNELVHIHTGAQIVGVTAQEYARLKAKFIFREENESFGILARYISERTRQEEHIKRTPKRNGEK